MWFSMKLTSLLLHRRINLIFLYPYLSMMMTLTVFSIPQSHQDMLLSSMSRKNAKIISSTFRRSFHLTKFYTSTSHFKYHFSLGFANLHNTFSTYQKIYKKS
uniref:Uncharacterized protein n=1 Tax=Opuntia streptacantha TaxID=393608 RepID=A0A7C9DU36_OPUST